MAKLLLIYTGGTIGMTRDPLAQSFKPSDFSEIISNMPELTHCGQAYDVYAFDPALDSSNMTPDNWVAMSEVIEKNYYSYDGFVILHGTDTMAYSASALSFSLENLSKPVIFTGAQLPIGEIRTDAKENLLTAMEIAAAKLPDGKPIVPEVCIFFDYILYRGNRATKSNAEYFQAFTSFNYPRLAEAGINIHYRWKNILPISVFPLRVHKKFDPAVATLKIYPGLDNKILENIVSLEGLKGLILETLGSGNVRADKRFFDLLKQASKNGIIILNISQCMGGSVRFGQYETSNPFISAGVLNGYDLTFEAALTKMMFVLAQDLSLEEKKRLLLTPLRGEITI